MPEVRVRHMQWCTVRYGPMGGARQLFDEIAEGPWCTPGNFLGVPNLARCGGRRSWLLWLGFMCNTNHGGSVLYASHDITTICCPVIVLLWRGQWFRKTFLLQGMMNRRMAVHNARHLQFFGGLVTRAQ